MPRFLLALFAALAALHAAAAGAQTYRWVDKDGRVHYTDNPPPGATATNVPNSVGTGAADSGPLPYAVQQAAKDFPVTVYTSENCSEVCKNARALLSKRGVPFREVTVADEKTRAELKRVSGSDSVPVMLVGKSATTGFEAETWQSALDGGGYPRFSPPLSAQAPKPAAPVAKAETPQPPRGPYAPEPAPAATANSGQTAPPQGPYMPR